MTTAEEIIEWAEKTREANGEAFTMLNKEEQLLIAKFMLAMRDHIKTLQNGTGEQKQTPPPPQTGKGNADDSEHTEEKRLVVDEETGSNRQTNMEFFKANNISMNRAFQLYQTWAEVDPDNRIVMDEKRRALVKSAGFAFWLNLPHE